MKGGEWGIKGVGTEWENGSVKGEGMKGAGEGGVGWADKEGDGEGKGRV